MKKVFLIIGLVLVIMGCENEQSTPKIQIKIGFDELNKGADLKSKNVSLVEIGKKVPDGVILNQDSVSLPIETFEGDLLVMSFWDNSSSTYMEKMETFRTIGKNYENRGVKFITISTEKKFDSWRRLMNEQDWGENNFWYGNKVEEPFYAFIYDTFELGDEKMYVPHHPTFVIISPDGEILDNRAPHPGTPEFIKGIYRFMEKYEI